jgi:hypothetical protein
MSPSVTDSRALVVNCPTCKRVIWANSRCLKCNPRVSLEDTEILVKRDIVQYDYTRHAKPNKGPSCSSDVEYD